MRRFKENIEKEREALKSPYIQDLVLQEEIIVKEIHEKNEKLQLVRNRISEVTAPINARLRNYTNGLNSMSIVLDFKEYTEQYFDWKKDPNLHTKYNVLGHVFSEYKDHIFYRNDNEGGIYMWKQRIENDSPSNKIFVTMDAYQIALSGTLTDEEKEKQLSFMLAKFLIDLE